jgi:hypothetical protein
MELTPGYDDITLLDIAAENVAPPPPKRPRLSLGEPASTSVSIHPDGLHDASETLHGPKLTRASVDYWRWKYEEVSQSAAALMPPGLLSSDTIAQGRFSSQPTAVLEPQLDADWELALEINMEMGLVPRTTVLERRGAGGSPIDHCADHIRRRSLTQTAEERLGNRLPHSAPPFEVKCVTNENHLELVRDNVHDLGVSLQRKAREQLDLIRMPPPEKEKSTISSNGPVSPSAGLG